MDLAISQLGQDLARAGYAKKTQYEYVAAARRLREHCGCEIDAITREQVRAFVDEVLSRTRAASTKRTTLCGLLFLFNRTLGKPEMVSFIRLPKKHSPLPTVLSLDEVSALLRAIRKPRYQAIAMVMYGAGLRISEALALEVRDIDGARGVIRVRHGKGDKAREAKMSQSLYLWLRAYWARERRRCPTCSRRARRGSLPSRSRCGKRSPGRRRELGSRSG